MDTKQTFFTEDVINYVLTLIYEIKDCKDFEKLCTRYGDENIKLTFYYLKFIKEHNKNVVPHYILKFADRLRKRHVKTNKITRARANKKYEQQELIL